jgi:choline dehydrogenase-like flavoprotein
VTGGGTHLVVGSGASAAMVALTLATRPDQQVTVLDLGGRLESGRQEVLQRVAGQDEASWDPEDLAAIAAGPSVDRARRVPQKRTYGSDYPFRDLGQVTGVRSRHPDTNLAVVSSAYGGFTNVWGAQVMPFSRSTFDDWPIGWSEMEPHYRASLGEVSLAAEEDDLAEAFPLLDPRSGLPTLGPRAETVMRRYDERREALQRQGVTVGRARLAFRAGDCIRCGLCMTGCPQSLLYSAAQTMDRVRRLPNVRYLDGLLVEQIGQDGDEAVARCRDLVTGERHEFRAERLFVGAGALGTTRLVLGSTAAPPSGLTMAESRQFVVPFTSVRAVEDPRRRGARDFTLNQFNVLLSFDREHRDTSLVHCYPYNPAFFAALPAPLRRPTASRAAAWLLRRLTVGFGYLPSWASPRIRVTARRAAAGGLPELELTDTAAERPPMVGAALRRLVRAAPALDLWPLLTHVALSGAGKSYHFGGSFPHRERAGGGPGTDRWGRLPEWDRVHLVDGSVLPTIASTTFTLTVMANARRIASEVLDGATTGRPRSAVETARQHPPVPVPEARGDGQGTGREDSGATASGTTGVPLLPDAASSSCSA